VIASECLGVDYSVLSDRTVDMAITGLVRRRSETRRPPIALQNRGMFDNCIHRSGVTRPTPFAASAPCV